jgi:hypothetical protein
MENFDGNLSIRIQSSGHRPHCLDSVGSGSDWPGSGPRRCQYLADMACVALNQLLPRYIRHDVDFNFYLSEAERQENVRQIEDSVTKAWAYVLEHKIEIFIIRYITRG